MTEINSSQATQVLGYSAIQKKAPHCVCLLAVFLDLAWVVALLSGCSYYFDFSPIPSEKTAFFELLALFSLVGLQIYLLRATVGQWVWKLRWKSKNNGRFKPRIYQVEYLSGFNLIFAIFLTTLAMGISFWEVHTTWRSHPFFQASSTVKLQTFLPEQDSKVDWIFLPWFYSHGLWPKTFLGNPVLYQFPYKKGPPHHFPEKINAKWEGNDVQLTIEGPKTPKHAPTQIELKNCMIRLKKFSPHCIRFTQLVLGRHLREMKSLKPQSWKIEWVEVDNPSLSSEEKPTGIWLNAEGESIGQDRFILIHPLGPHQAFILNRPVNDTGEFAKKIFENSIRSLKINRTLMSGKEWVNQRLTETHLDDLENPSISPQTFLSKIAEIQSVLLSKISVDPKPLDPYFHLGGTSLLLAQKGRELKNSDWSEQARPLLSSALRYAEDVAPGDQRTKQLKMLLERLIQAEKNF